MRVQCEGEGVQCEGVGCEVHRCSVWCEVYSVRVQGEGVRV